MKINGKTYKKIISKIEAAKIAEKEAQKDKYDYTGKNSDFQAIFPENEDYPITGVLIKEKHKDRVYYLKDRWDTGKYNGQLMWEIRLFDKNKELTSLYIYVDAITGEILGAGDLSD